MVMPFKTAKHMKFFWNKANTSIKWKLQVFNAVGTSKILSGLESIQLTQADLKQLDALQVKNSHEKYSDATHPLMLIETKLTTVS